MAVVILLLLIYIAYLLKNCVKPQQVVIMDSTGKPMDNAGAHRTIAPGSYSSMPSYAVPSPQSDFFKKSVEYATDYVAGKVQFNIASVPMSAQQVLTTVSILNDAVKQNIITAIKYVSVDVTTASDAEKKLRLMSEQERIPLWIVLIRDASSKAVPYIDFSNNNFNPNYVNQPQSSLSLVKNTA